MSNKDSIDSKDVWGKWLRLSHWGIALSTVTLMATGWLINHSPAVADAASDWHYIVGSVFNLSLLLRIGLLFADKGAGQFMRMMAIIQPSKIIDTLKSYLTLGKFPLPRWYSHNPLWVPIYVFVFAFMLVTAISGQLQADYPVLWGLYLPSIHSGMATLVSVFAITHVAAVFFHDWKGERADISAMINGRKFFVIKATPPPASAPREHTISLDSLKSNLKKKAP